jgi:hypothetical protein
MEIQENQLQLAMDIIYGGRGEFSRKDEDKQTSEQPS